MKSSKFIPLFIILSISQVLQSCEHSVDRTYIIENGTDHSIEIELYQRSYDSQTHSIVVNTTLSETIVLEKNGDVWSKTYQEDMATGVSVSIALEGDSAVIFYDDSRIQYYSISDTSDRSLLNDEAYIIESEKEKKRTHIGVRRYLFTERDYESATEVGG